uniref:Protein max n=1 Tax=Gasterosteus aculeatus aculeatus TaxID=481459 RepID=A0AAQ4QGS9_GASAC
VITTISKSIVTQTNGAHHNALERKRRDHIKDSFHSLRDSVPALQGEKVGKAQPASPPGTRCSGSHASRAQILDKATEYIQYMRRKNHTHQQDIDDLKRQNALLEQQGNKARRVHTNNTFRLLLTEQYSEVWGKFHICSLLIVANVLFGTYATHCYLNCYA